MDLLNNLGLYYFNNYEYVLEQFFRHFLLSAYGVFFAAVVAIPVGIIVARYRKLSPWMFSIANILQTIPSLAMLSVLMIVMGLGANTVVFGLFLYSLLPILQNTYTGITTVDSTLLESGEGMGMTKGQLLRLVELPLALSVIMAGLRTALVVSIGIATIGTFIGSGGLGDIIIRGINASDGAAIILAGAIPAAVMAFVIDIVLAYLEALLSPFKRKSKGKVEREV